MLEAKSFANRYTRRNETLLSVGFRFCGRRKAKRLHQLKGAVTSTNRGSEEMRRFEEEKIK